MAKIYTKTTWTDEVLAGNERYNILEDGGGAFKANMQIALATTVAQAGTAADASKMNNLENGMDALDTLLSNLLSGWIAGGTWTYASAATFTVPGDQTALLTSGTKIKLTQTTVKYFYVVSASYSSPNTTVTISGGSDYALANAAITNPFYSYLATPPGFPGAFNWVPTFAGFSADPSGGVYRFSLNGKRCIVDVEMPAGTSNGTGLTLTAPLTAANIAGMNWRGLAGVVTDDSAGQSVAGRVFIGPGGATITCYKTVDSSVLWTAFGTKRACFALTYEIG